MYQQPPSNQNVPTYTPPEQPYSQYPQPPPQDYPSYPPPPYQQPPPPKRKRRIWLWIVGIIVVFIVIGTFASRGGTTTSTPPVATNAPATGSTPAATSAPAVTPTPTPKPSPTFAHFGDGTYQVGKDIQPGTYRIRVGSPGCYFARLKGFGGTIDDIIANNNVSAPTIVTISSSDKGFQSSGCGTWTKQ
jgi:hypothetical protein